MIPELIEKTVTRDGFLIISKENNMKNRLIIIGGMGPQASLLLHKRIIDGAIERGALEGADFPEIVHVSLPVDDFISDVSKTNAAFQLIQSTLERLYYWRSRQDCYSMQYCSFISRAS